MKCSLPAEKRSSLYPNLDRLSGEARRNSLVLDFPLNINQREQKDFAEKFVLEGKNLYFHRKKIKSLPKFRRIELRNSMVLDYPLNSNGKNRKTQKDSVAKIKSLAKFSQIELKKGGESDELGSPSFELQLGCS